MTDERHDRDRAARPAPEGHEEHAESHQRAERLQRPEDAELDDLGGLASMDEEGLSDGRGEVAQALRELTAAEGRRPASARRPDHLGEDELLSYRAGSLAAADADAVREHLVACSECAGLLLELASFESGPVAPLDLSPSDVDAAWLALVPKLPPALRRPGDGANVRELPGSSAAPPAGLGATPPDRSRRRTAQPLLASLLAASVLLNVGGAVWSSRREALAERRAKAAEVMPPEGPEELLPPPVTRGNVPGSRIDYKPLFSRGDVVTLVIPVPGGAAADELKVEIRDRSHRELSPEVIDSRGELARFPRFFDTRDKPDQIRLKVRRGWLPTGDYDLIVTGFRDGSPLPGQQQVYHEHF